MRGGVPRAPAAWAGRAARRRAPPLRCAGAGRPDGQLQPPPLQRQQQQHEQPRQQDQQQQGRRANHRVRRRRRRFATFEAARLAAREASAGTRAEYEAWIESEGPTASVDGGGRGGALPRRPDEVYSSAWVSWPDFLDESREGTPARASVSLPFAEARTLVRMRRLRSRAEFEACRDSRMPRGIPAAPHQTYAGRGWTCWDDFLDLPGEPPDWEICRAVVRSMGLAGPSAYAEACESADTPRWLPADPQTLYAARWKGWRDFLHVRDGVLLPRSTLVDVAGDDADESEPLAFMPYREACASARALGLTSHRQYRQWHRLARPRGLPRNPRRLYADEWESWPDFLDGPEAGVLRSRSLLGFEDARRLARTLGPRSSTQWLAFCSQGHRPSTLPLRPDMVYATKGWVSWKDFLREPETDAHREGRARGA